MKDGYTPRRNLGADYAGRSEEESAGLDGGRLVANLMHFARLLRAAGIPIGPGGVIDGIRAVQAVGVTRRSDFYWALHAVFVHHGEQRALFDQAFHRFWREPVNHGELIAELVAASRLGDPVPPSPPATRRLAEVLPESARHAPTVGEKTFEFEAASYSPREILRKKDFEQMSGEEIDEAKREMARLALPVRLRPTRRFRSAAREKRVDMRASDPTRQRAGRRSGDLPPLDGAAPPTTSPGCGVRHIGLHGAVHAHVPPLPSRSDEPRGPGSDLPFWDAAKPRHPTPPPSGRGRGPPHAR